MGDKGAVKNIGAVLVTGGWIVALEQRERHRDGLPRRLWVIEFVPH